MFSQGDSGGPLFQEDKTGVTLVGIGSYSFSHDCSSAPAFRWISEGMYTDIRPYMGDIRDVLRKEGIVSLFRLTF